MSVGLVIIKELIIASSFDEGALLRPDALCSMVDLTGGAAEVDRIAQRHHVMRMLLQPFTTRLYTIDPVMFNRAQASIARGWPQCDPATRAQPWSQYVADVCLAIEAGMAVRAVMLQHWPTKSGGRDQYVAIVFEFLSHADRAGTVAATEQVALVAILQVHASTVQKRQLVQIVHDAKSINTDDGMTAWTPFSGTPTALLSFAWLLASAAYAHVDSCAAWILDH